MKNKLPLAISKFGVVGNPVKHSLSPQIHSQFARQFEHLIEYNKYQIEPENLKSFILEFFSKGGVGLNITVPYKQKVLPIVDKLSDAAKVANSVNTLFIDNDNQLVGDTTDGRGLLLDLQSRGFQVKHKKILVVGAGGASQSILLSLLKAGALVSVINRTASKVEKLQKQFSSLGEIKVFDQSTIFTGIISATTEFNQTLMAPVSDSLNQNTFCYDLNYAQRAKDFKRFSLENGCQRFADGMGMLFGQAAITYQIWHQVLPNMSLLNISD